MVVISQETTSPDAQGKVQVSGARSRFSRFGFGSQLLQKTVGLVMRPRSGNQVSLVVLYSYSGLFSFSSQLYELMSSDCSYSNGLYSAPS